MTNARNLTRRQALLMGVGGFLAAELSPTLAVANNGEDPAAIITDIANDAFELFGALNGVSDDWSSRREWAKSVTRSRFATKLMGEKAGGPFLREFSASKRRTFDLLIENVVAEFILDIFALFSAFPSHFGMPRSDVSKSLIMKLFNRSCQDPYRIRSGRMQTWVIIELAAVQSLLDSE